MTPRQATIFLLWYGEKALAGDEPTPEEHDKFLQARQISIYMAKKWMRIKDEDFAYTPGESFKGM